MENRRSFGRRAAPRIDAVPVAARAPNRSEEELRLAAPDFAPPSLSVEDEIRAWKSARGSVVGFPWRQLSLMAGLCFGIASFVLPATVNDAVQWPLYVLAAAGLFTGLHKRKVKPG